MEILKSPNGIDLAYFSGFFDGEGCVYLHRKLRGEKQPSYKLQVQIGSTYFPILEWIQNTWGFGRITKESYEKRTNRKPTWFWVVHGDKALFVIETIFPYLIIKKSDAQVGISFQRWKLREAATYGQTTARLEASLVKEQRAKELLARSRGIELLSARQEVENLLGKDNLLLENNEVEIKTSRIMDLAFFAGLFDAEGYVTMGKKLNYRGSFDYTLAVGMTNTNLPMIEWVRLICGFGSVVTQGIDQVKRPNHKQYWKWFTTSNKALTVLESIYPYLIVKKADAEVGIAFQKWKSKETSRWGKGNRPESSYIKEEKARNLLTDSRDGNLSIVRRQIETILESKEEQRLF